jgi:hypothetical protein
MNRQKLITLIVAFAILISGFLIYNKISTPKINGRRKQRAPKELWLQAQKVEYATESIELEYSGKVISANSQDLIVFASGTLLQGDVPFRKGQTFKKGELLYKIKEDETLLELKSLRSNFKNKIADVLPEIKLSFFEDYEIFNSYYKSIKLDSEIPKLPEVEDYQLRNFLNSRNVYSQYFALQKSELNLSYLSFIAPFDGVISETSQTIGNRVTTGRNIATIFDTENIEVEISIPQEVSSLINEKSTCSILNSNQSIKGKFLRKSPLLNKQTLTQTVYVKASDDFLIGDFVNVKFSGIELDNVEKIARNLISNDEKIRIIHNGILNEIKVERILDTDEFSYIRRVPEDYYIVSQQIINISMNQPVKIIGVDNPATKGSKKE